MNIYFFIKVALALGLFAGLLGFLQKARERLYVWRPVSTISIRARAWLIVRPALIASFDTFAYTTVFGLLVCAIIFVFFYL